MAFVWSSANVPSVVLAGPLQGMEAGIKPILFLVMSLTATLPLHCQQGMEFIELEACSWS